jgi:flagellar export protein FliJ
VKKRDPIGALMKVRSYREKQARSELAAARLKVVEATGVVDTRRSEYEQRPGIAPVVSPDVLLTHQLAGTRSLERIAEAARTLECVRNDAEDSRGRWKVSKDHLRSAEKLADRRDEEATDRARLAAQKALDQLVVMMRKRRT